MASSSSKRASSNDGGSAQKKVCFKPDPMVEVARKIQQAGLPGRVIYQSVNGDGNETSWAWDRYLFNPNPANIPTRLEKFPKRVYYSDAAAYGLLRIIGNKALLTTYVPADFNSDGKIVKNRTNQGYPAIDEQGHVFRYHSADFRGHGNLNLENTVRILFNDVSTIKKGFPGASKLGDWDEIFALWTKAFPAATPSEQAENVKKSSNMEGKKTAAKVDLRKLEAERKESATKGKNRAVTDANPIIGAGASRTEAAKSAQLGGHGNLHDELAKLIQVKDGHPLFAMMVMSRLIGYEITDFKETPLPALKCAEVKEDPKLKMEINQLKKTVALRDAQIKALQNQVADLEGQNATNANRIRELTTEAEVLTADQQNLVSLWQTGKRECREQKALVNSLVMLSGYLFHTAPFSLTNTHGNIVNGVETDRITSLLREGIKRLNRMMLELPDTTLGLISRRNVVANKARGVYPVKDGFVIFANTPEIYTKSELPTIKGTIKRLAFGFDEVEVRNGDDGLAKDTTADEDSDEEQGESEGEPNASGDPEETDASSQ